MTDFVKVHQTGDGTCGVYSIACQFASLFVQAQSCFDTKEKLNDLITENLDGFRDFFHCLNRFHGIPLIQQLHPGNFGSFIQKNIHTLRDLELFVGPAMRLLFETQVNKYDEDIALNLLCELKDKFTEAHELFQLCQLFGLNLINFKNAEINPLTAENFSELSALPIDMDSTFNMRVLHNGTDHFDSVFVYHELDSLFFDLVPAECEDQIMYVDSQDPFILTKSKNMNGSDIWQRKENFFLKHVFALPVEINPYANYTPMQQISADEKLAKQFALEEAIDFLDGAEVNEDIALEMQQARALDFSKKTYKKTV